MNAILATLLLRNRDRSRSVSIAQFDDRLLNDIGLCRSDFRGGRITKKTA